MSRETQDADYWAAFFEREHAGLIAIGVAWLGRLEDSRDLVQEVIVRIVERGQPIEQPKAYCARAIRNAAIDRLRREQRLPDVLPLGPVCDQLIDNRAAASVGRSEENEYLQRLLKEISAEQREVVVLKIYAGLTLAEVSETLGIPEGTAATRYRRGLAAMRDRIAREQFDVA